MTNDGIEYKVTESYAEENSMEGNLHRVLSENYKKHSTRRLN